MAKVPGPRKPGQTGGGGRMGQAGNRSRSQARGGRPHAGGAGGGKRPGKSSSSASAPVVGIAFALFIGIPLSLVGSIAYYILHGHGVI